MAPTARNLLEILERGSNPVNDKQEEANEDR